MKFENNFKEIIIESVFQILFASLITLSFISNYKTIYLIAKIALNFALGLFLYLNFIRNNKKPEINFKKLLISQKILGAFFCISLVSLSYSQNFSYGLQKLIHIFTNIPILIIATYYFLVTPSKLRFKILFCSTIGIGMLSILYIIILNPLHYNGIYSFSSNAWSHVYYGRIIGFLFIVALASLVYSTNRIMTITSLILAIIFGYGNLITGLRSGIVAVLTTTSVQIIWIIFYQKEKRKKIFLIFFALLGGLLIYKTVLPNNTSLDRVEVLTKTQDLKFGNDGTINIRVNLYLTALERFLEHPISGLGLGGFSSQYKGEELSVWNRYPHNIILEFAVELGFLGIILFFLFTYQIFQQTLKFSFLIALFYIFPFVLSMFSKDLPSQAILFTGLAFSWLTEADISKFKQVLCDFVSNRNNNTFL